MLNPENAHIKTEMQAAIFTDFLKLLHNAEETPTTDQISNMLIVAFITNIKKYADKGYIIPVGFWSSFATGKTFKSLGVSAKFELEPEEYYYDFMDSLIAHFTDDGWEDFPLKMSVERLLTAFSTNKGEYK